MVKSYKAIPIKTIDVILIFQSETEMDDNATLALLAEFIDAKFLAGELLAMLAERSLSIEEMRYG